MARQFLILLVVVAVFGVLVPWYKGATVLQPLVLLAYALMALLFVAPAGSEFWSAMPTPASPGAMISRMIVIVGYGWGIAVLMLVTAVVTLNLAYRTERLLMPPTPFLAATLLFSLTASAAVAVVCALLAGRFSAAGAKALVRAFFLLLLCGLAFGSRVLPDSWQIMLADHSTRRAVTRLAWEGSAVSALAVAVGALLLRRSAPKSQAVSN
jgi:xanthosine utilization system XapX-like protein